VSHRAANANCGLVGTLRRVLAVPRTTSSQPAVMLLHSSQLHPDCQAVNTTGSSQENWQLIFVMKTVGSTRSIILVLLLAAAIKGAV